jgi:hypothetical protein
LHRRYWSGGGTARASGGVDARAGSGRGDTAGGATGAVSAPGAAWAAALAASRLILLGERGPRHPVPLFQQRHIGIQASIDFEPVQMIGNAGLGDPTGHARGACPGISDVSASCVSLGAKVLVESGWVAHLEAERRLKSCKNCRSCSDRPFDRARAA